MYQVKSYFMIIKGTLNATHNGEISRETSIDRGIKNTISRSNMKSRPGTVKNSEPSARREKTKSFADESERPSTSVSKKRNSVFFDFDNNPTPPPPKEIKSKVAKYIKGHTVI